MADLSNFIQALKSDWEYFDRVDELLNDVDDQVMQDEQGPVDEFDDCA
jgi:uncharacterized protein YdcH (DUF465 family)